MTAILEPKPRRASNTPQQLSERVPLLLSPPIYTPGEMTRSLGPFNPPRLMSPVNLTSPVHHKSNLSKQSSSCSSSKRRRTHASGARVSRRRRADCPPPFSSSSVFDALPWISQVERAPQRVDIWDLADLSLLPDEPPRHSYSSSGVGPVRRRRTSARSGVPPLGGGKATETVASVRKGFPVKALSSHAKDGDEEHLLPMHLLPAYDRENGEPCTPPPSYPLDPREVNFHRLMPIFHVDPELHSFPRDPTWSRTSSPSPM